MAMLIPVILSGGVGARLWPVSRQSQPKPFMQLADGESLIQKTFNRLEALGDLAEILVVTNRDHYFQTLDAYQALPLSQRCGLRFVLEPCGRNTAPAIALAALQVAELYGDSAQLLVLPADHLIARTADFAAAVALARQLAARDYLVTFGLKPQRPDTGFGYIEAGEPFCDCSAPAGLEAAAVSRFAEKPCQRKAEEYLASGRHLWNAGIFCFSAGALLAGLQRYTPDLFDAVSLCWQQTRRDIEPLQLPAPLFSEVPDISIDYALLERADNVAVIRCDLGWDDVGSWDALAAQLPADALGNRREGAGEVLLHASRNCYVRSEERLVTAVGVENLIIIDTADALLVLDRRHCQDVKVLVDQLKRQGHPCYHSHRTVHRPWGTYTVLEQGERFKIKRIVVKPAASLSLQMHYHRCEHWVVVSGTARIINGDKEMLLCTNESTYIPAGHRHRLENPGRVPLVMIEVQSGEYLEEDDIVRFDDVYQR
ncbi:mannose-1-phosphate guanylyltransferase/mannose-6-phosphate isomerase [Desulfuromonas thiophila]|uniref:mannose-1-phosphate guanylyltransferase/mannose-6-phosphate isomerase n=1 Tax=Desulfuromonas thiophila TaxID=57664 RepID=UPI0031F5D2F1